MWSAIASTSITLRPIPRHRNLSSSTVLLSSSKFAISFPITTTNPQSNLSLTVRNGGGPRTFPGGVSKWQWKRMQAKKAQQLLKARLCRERQIYEMRKRAELKAAVSELERPWEVVERAPTLFSVKADEQVKVLADRFQKPGGFDMWSENDGPQVFRTPEGLPSARFFPKGVVHSVKPYGVVAGEVEEGGGLDNEKELDYRNGTHRGGGRRVLGQGRRNRSRDDDLNPADSRGSGQEGYHTKIRNSRTGTASFGRKGSASKLDELEDSDKVEERLEFDDWIIRSRGGSRSGSSQPLIRRQNGGKVDGLNPASFRFGTAGTSYSKAQDSTSGPPNPYGEEMSDLEFSDEEDGAEFDEMLGMGVGGRQCSIERRKGGRLKGGGNGRVQDLSFGASRIISKDTSHSRASNVPGRRNGNAAKTFRGRVGDETSDDGDPHTLNPSNLSNSRLSRFDKGGKRMLENNAYNVNRRRQSSMNQLDSSEDTIPEGRGRIGKKNSSCRGLEGSFFTRKF